MRKISPELAAQVAVENTRLCRCWRFTASSGVRLGFTDHDRDLEFDGTRFQAATGLAPGAMEIVEGLAVDNMEATGVLSSGSLTESDLAAGVWDNAVVEMFRVSWIDPSHRVLMHMGSLGEVARRGRAFRAELRGLTHHLSRSAGRVYAYGCDAELGDARCGVSLADPRRRRTVSAAAGSTAEEVSVTGADDLPPGWFLRGRLSHDGLVRAISGDRSGGEHRHLALWEPLRTAPPAGAQIILTAGCDKQAATCRDKFSNIANYRGFPHMPGNDFIQSYPRPGGAHDGGRRA